MIILRIQIFIVFLIGLPFAKVTFAQTFTGKPQPLTASQITLMGSFADNYAIATNSTVSAQLHLNRNKKAFHTNAGVPFYRRTATFQRFTFHIEDFSIRRNLASDFGQSVPIKLTIAFDDIEFGSDKEFALMSGTNGQFAVYDFDEYIHPSPVNLSGSYEITGPTETKRGTFSFTLGWQRSAQSNTDLTCECSEEQLPFWRWEWSTPIIDTANYPNGVVMTRSPGWQGVTGYDGLDIFRGTIDGADIHFFISYVELSAPNPMRFVLDAEAEQSGITGLSRSANSNIIIDGTGTVGSSDSAEGPFSGKINLPAIIQPESSSKFFKAN